MLTLQGVVDALPAFGKRNAVGLREDLGLRWWSYERLHRHALRAASLLRDVGVGKGDRVLIRGRNSPEWVAFFFGCVLRGAVAVPVDHDAAPEFICRVAGAAKPKLIVASEASGLAHLGPLLPFDILYADHPPPGEELVVPVSPSDPVVIFFTSGTTSEPRGVVLTHANVAAQIARFRGWRFLARTAGARMLVMAPFSHSQGFVLGIAIPLSMGLSAIYTASSHPGHLVRLLRDNRVPILSTVPRVLHLLGRHFQSQPYGRGKPPLGEKARKERPWILRRHFAFTHLRRQVSYSSLWVVMVGGAPLPEADEDFWRVTGCLLIQGYGLTETTAIVSINAPMLGAFGSVGKPFDDQEIRIAGDGEILVRGANVMSGDDEFLHTGDLGRIDSRKRLFILGRKKALIVTGEGFNVRGSDVEEVVNAMPGVEDSVVIGLEREGHAEVHAVLLLRNGAKPAAIVSGANQRLQPQQRIASWTVWPEPDFPRSALMKPKLAQIEARVAAGIATPDRVAAPPRSLDDVLAIEERQQRIAALANYIVAGGGGDLSLVRGAGLSSLALIELLAHLEKQSGRTLDHAALDESITLSGLRALVTNHEGEQELDSLHAVDAPRWAELPPLNFLRRALNPLVLGALAHLRTRLTVTGLENLEGLELPAIFAGSGHAHGFDVVLIYSALPARLRKRLALVTSRWVFTDAFTPRPDSTLAQRLLVGAGFHVILPLFFPFVLSSQYTRSRDMLMEACRLIDRRYSLIAFQGKGVGLVARQCGVPIVPVRVGNAAHAGFLPRFTRPATSIHFEPPIVPDPRSDPEELTEKLEAFFSTPEA